MTFRVCFLSLPCIFEAVFPSIPARNRQTDAVKDLHNEFTGSFFDTPGSLSLQSSMPAAFLAFLTSQPEKRPTAKTALEILLSLGPQQDSKVSDPRVRRLRRKTDHHELPTPQKLAKVSTEFPFQGQLPGSIPADSKTSQHKLPAPQELPNVTIEPPCQGPSFANSPVDSTKLAGLPQDLAASRKATRKTAGVAKGFGNAPTGFSQQHARWEISCSSGFNWQQFHSRLVSKLSTRHSEVQQAKLINASKFRIVWKRHVTQEHIKAYFQTHLQLPQSSFTVHRCSQ